MGFFSSDCRGCDRSITSQYCGRLLDTAPFDPSMMVVLPRTSGPPVAAYHDGYGNKGLIDDCEVWHNHCWQKQGSPTKFTKLSRPSEDQGYFLDKETWSKFYSFKEEDQ